METFNVHQAHTLAKKDEIKPTALNDQAACGADGRKVWCGVTTEGEACSDEAGTGEIGAVVVVDLDLASEDLLQKRINVAIPIRPMCIDKVKAKGDEDESRGETQ